MENNILLDANAILRFLMDDVHDQHLKVKDTIENNDCFLILPVVQEAVYVLDGFYNVPRDLIRRSFTELKDAVRIEDEDVYLKAFDYFIETPKLDFVDCILCSYRTARGLDVLSFDEKLNRKIESISYGE